MLTRAALDIHFNPNPSPCCLSVPYRTKFHRLRWPLPVSVSDLPQYSALQTPVSRMLPWATSAYWGHSIPFFSHDSTSGHLFPKAFPSHCQPATATPALLTEKPLLASPWAVWGQSPKGAVGGGAGFGVRGKRRRGCVWWQPNMCGACFV